MTDQEIIDRIGGSSEVARLCQVTVGAVSQWRNDGIPRARLMYLRLARPDAFIDAVTINESHEASMHNSHPWKPDPKDQRIPIAPPDTASMHRSFGFGQILADLPVIQRQYGNGLRRSAMRFDARLGLGFVHQALRFGFGQAKTGFQVSSQWLLFVGADCAAGQSVWTFVFSGADGNVAIISRRTDNY